MMVPTHLSVYHNLGDITVFDFSPEPSDSQPLVSPFPPTKTGILRGEGPGKGKPDGGLNLMSAPPLFRMYRILLISISSLLRSLTDSSASWGLGLDDKLDDVL